MTEEVQEKPVPTLRDILSDEELALLFRSYLHDLACSENLSFWLEVEEFRNLSDKVKQVRSKRAAGMFKKYFDPSSKYVINADVDLKKAVEKKIKENAIDSNLFDDLQHSVYLMLEYDSYRKFVNSPTFQQFLAEGYQPHNKKKGRLSIFKIRKRRNEKEKEKAKMKERHGHEKSESLIMLEKFVETAKQQNGDPTKDSPNSQKKSKKAKK